MKRKYNENSTLFTNNLNSINNKKENHQELFVRNTEHIDGNWPSHIYLKGNYKLINDISSICIKHHTLASKSSELGDMIAIEEPHISLSKPFVLRFHQIIPFIKLLNQSFQNLFSFNVEIQSQYKLLKNDYNTRLFLSLPVYDMHNKMSKLIEKVDHCLKQYQQPAYYLSPLYHISIASIPLNSDRILPIVTDEFITLSKEDVDDTRLEKNDFEHKEPVIITQAYDNNSDDDYNWQESMQHHLRKTPYYYKHSCINIEHSSTNTTHNTNISLSTTNQATITSLLTNYTSDDEDDNNDITNDENISCSKKEAGLYQIITIDSIECKIGNKLFRLLLPNSDQINQKNMFVEM